MLAYVYALSIALYDISWLTLAFPRLDFMKRRATGEKGLSRAVTNHIPARANWVAGPRQQVLGLELWRGMTASQ